VFMLLCRFLRLSCSLLLTRTHYSEIRRIAAVLWGNLWGAPCAKQP
jgi:hypothetical protein